MYCGDCVELGCHSTSEDCYDCSGCSDLRGKFQVKCESKNGLSDVCFYVEKFDTAASMNMSDPLWGGPARTEIGTLINTTAIVEVDRAVAMDCIKNHGADLVVLFPVYEKKVKDGVTVYKVRLVGDGRTLRCWQHICCHTKSRGAVGGVAHNCVAWMELCPRG